MSVTASTTLLTRADLDALPEDGLRHELIDGAFIMSPSPGVPHQTIAFALGRALHAAAAGTGLKVLLAPLDVVLGPHVVEPDVVVAPATAFTPTDLPTAPILVAEVRSASTAWLDEGRKLALYAQYGVSFYLLADPRAPSIQALHLVNGQYVQVGAAVGDQSIDVSVPFAVSLNPVALLRG